MGLVPEGNVEDHEDAGRTTSKTGPNYQWLSAWELHRTERHGVQGCRWLWPSTLSNEEEPVQSSPVPEINAMIDWSTTSRVFQSSAML